MSTALVIKTLISIVLATVIFCAIGLARSHYKNEKIIEQRIYGGLKSQTIDLNPEVYSDLPDPVQKYFAFAFNGQKKVTLKAIEWRQNGKFQLPEVGEFYAKGKQVNRPNEPVYAFLGIFWRFGVPLMESRDAFFLDAHDMRAKLFGWFKVMHTDYEKKDEIKEARDVRGEV